MPRLALPLLFLCLSCLTSFGQHAHCRRPIETPSVAICQLDEEMSPLFPSLRGHRSEISERVLPLERGGGVADVAEKRIAQANLTGEKDGLVTVRKRDFRTDDGVAGIRILYEYRKVYIFAGEEFESHDERIEYLFDSSTGQLAFIVFKLSGESVGKDEQVADELVRSAVIK